MSDNINLVAKYAFSDWARTLWPLRLERVLFQHFSTIVNESCEKMGLFSTTAEEPAGLRPAIRAYAAKHGHHCRRTLKPDPLVTWFLYRWTYSHRVRFRKPASNERLFYGYRFLEGAPISVDAAAKKFRRSEFYVREHATLKSLRFDLSHYFNSLYHHDILNQLSLAGFELEEVNILGKVLRWLSAGRSVDCLPQGLFSTKMIGNYVLVPVDNDIRIKSERLYRLMDDFILADQDQGRLLGDFHRIQQILGEMALNINPDKTRLPEQTYRTEIGLSGEERTLGEFVKSIADETEEKARVRLRFTRREHTADSDELQKLVVVVLSNPDLMKQFSYWMRGLAELGALLEILVPALTEYHLTDYQLFWLAHICDEHLSNSKHQGEILNFVLSHPAASNITKARALEVPTTKFGLPAIREEYLKRESGWLCWCAGIGMLQSPKASRNQIAKYIRNDGFMGRMMAKVIHDLDPEKHDLSLASDLAA